MKPFAMIAVAALLVPVLALAADDKAEKKKKKNKGPDTEAVFAKLDADKDGKLSKDEFAKAGEELKKKKADAAKKPGKGNKRIDALLSKIDENKDGSVSKDEFKKLPEVMKAAKQDKKKKQQ